MGIEFRLINLLFEAKEIYSVKFNSVMTIGRQSLVISDVQQFIKKFRKNIQKNDIYASNDYAEKLFKYLGASKISSLDISDYESASDIHNMNDPINAAYDKKYTVVLDGGSLEHIVNFPCAILNCMRMVAVGGHFISMVPSNNLYGHGFYQFSPELYAGILSSDNGFVVERILLIPTHNKNKVIEINKDTLLDNTLGCSTSDAYYLYVQARKIKHITKLAYPSQRHIGTPSANISFLRYLPNVFYLIIRRFKLLLLADRFPKAIVVSKHENYSSRGK